MNRGRGLALLATVALLIGPRVPAEAVTSPRRFVEQLRARGIRDERVLEAMGRVPREAFAPVEVREHAYDDEPLPIGHGQTMSQPYMVALMTELLGLRGDENVLEIGTGSGYHAAVLAELARQVCSIEIVPELATSARLRLTRAGYRNVHVKQGDGNLGWRDYGPYDAVVVTAAAPSVPRALIEQLREGGLLVMPLGAPGGRQTLVRGVKRGLKLYTREVTEVRFVPLTGTPTRAPKKAVREEPAPTAAGGRREGEHPPATGTPRRGVIEEDLAPDGERPRSPGPDQESGTRVLPAERTRAARAPAAPDSGRRCVAGEAAHVAVDSRRAARRCAV